MSPVNPQPSNALALYNQGLKGLHYQAHTAPDKALKQSAQQFEALFINEMLKSMRESVPQSGLLNNEQTKTFTAMHDQQLSQDIATHRGLGLADMIIRQLEKKTIMPQPASAPAETNVTPTSPAPAITGAVSAPAQKLQTLDQGLKTLKNLPDVSINKGGGLFLKD